jgi:hypothetical protein
MPIGMALSTESEEDGRTLWRLTAHGAEVPGVWDVGDGEFRLAERSRPRRMPHENRGILRAVPGVAAMDRSVLARLCHAMRAQADALNVESADAAEAIERAEQVIAYARLAHVRSAELLRGIISRRTSGVECRMERNGTTGPCAAAAAHPDSEAAAGSGLSKLTASLFWPPLVLGLAACPFRPPAARMTRRAKRPHQFTPLLKHHIIQRRQIMSQVLPARPTLRHVAIDLPRLPTSDDDAFRAGLRSSARGRLPGD